MFSLGHVFDYTKSSNINYYNSIFEQRSEFSNQRAGSFYSMHPYEIEDMLYNAVWKETEDVYVGEGKKAYKTDIGGFFGMVHIDELSEDCIVCMTDPKNTGFVSATLYDHSFIPSFVENTYAITSLNDDKSEFLLTVFPGPDIPPNEVLIDSFKKGEQLTVRDIAKVGIRYVKLA